MSAPPIVVAVDGDGVHTLVMGAPDVRMIQAGLERAILQAEARRNETAEKALRDLLTRLRRGIEHRSTS